ITILLTGHHLDPSFRAHAGANPNTGSRGPGWARDGPVQFEKDTTDPFGIDSMIADVTGGAGQKRYGIQEVEREDRGSKRARVDDD
ncbi:mRNA splicing protein, partial [Aspergillus fumigatus]